MVFFDNPLNGADNEFSRDLARIERRQRNFHLPHVRRVRRAATIGSRYIRSRGDVRAHADQMAPPAEPQKQSLGLGKIPGCLAKEHSAH